MRSLHMVNNPLRRQDTFPPAAAFGELTGQLCLGIHNAPWLVGQLNTIVADEEAQGNLSVKWMKTYPDLVECPPLPDKLYLGPLSCCQDPKVYKDLDIGYIIHWSGVVRCLRGNDCAVAAQCR